jgi:hypothetical protein
MKNKLMAILAVAVTILVMASGPLFAHHGNAAYDNAKTVVVKGTITEWIWANPHCWLKFDEKDDKGEVKHWIVEASNPPDMTRNGWAKNSFKSGDEVTVTLIPAKNGLPVGRFKGERAVVLASGQVFSSGGGGTIPVVNPAVNAEPKP